MIFFSFFAASIVATAAYLQAEAAVWKGLVGAAALFALGAANMFFLQMNSSESAANSPQIGITTSLTMGALLIALGSITSLILRSRLSAERIAMVAFIGSWVLLQILNVVV